MHPESVGNIRGGVQNAASDLNKLDKIFRTWHLIHCPKLEYYYFLEKVDKLGKHRDVMAYVQKMRNHYKGVEVLEEFQ